MSELSKALRDVEALRNHVRADILAGSAASGASASPAALPLDRPLNAGAKLSSSKSLRSWRSDHLNLNETYKRFCGKLGKLDPVTGEPVYGMQMRSKVAALGAALASLEEDLAEIEQRQRNDGIQEDNELDALPANATFASVNNTIDKFITMKNDSARVLLDSECAVVTAEDAAKRAARRLMLACANVRAHLASWTYMVNKQYSASWRFGKYFRAMDEHLGAVDRAVEELRSFAAAQVAFCRVIRPTINITRFVFDHFFKGSGILGAWRGIARRGGHLGRSAGAARRRKAAAAATPPPAVNGWCYCYFCALGLIVVFLVLFSCFVMKERITFIGWPALRLLLSVGFELSGPSSQPNSTQSSSFGSDFTLGPTSVLPWIERLSMHEEPSESQSTSSRDVGGSSLGGGGAVGRNPSPAFDALMLRAMAPIEANPLIAGIYVPY